MSDEIRVSDHALGEVYAEATKTTDGYEMEIYKPDKVKVKGYTPNEELRELIEQWREIADANPVDQHESGYLSATDARADELEAVLDE